MTEVTTVLMRTYRHSVNGSKRADLRSFFEAGKS